jgi:Ring finger domain
MASPNVKVDKSVKIRRRNTLPGPLHKIRHQSALLQKRHTSCGVLPSSISSRSSSNTSSSAQNNARWHHLHQSKTNPYVGWFRHAPSLTTVPTVSLPKLLSTGSKVVNVDTLWLRDWLVDGKVFHQCKKRRIVVKDHNFTQFKYQQDKIKSTLFQLKQVMENSSDTRDLNLDLLLLYRRRSGHLRGGGTENDDDIGKESNDLDDTTIEQYLQRQYASSTESITIKALSRIACWLLDVPVNPSTTSKISLKESHMEGVEEVGSILSYDDDDDDDTRSVYSYDNHDTISGSRFRTSLSSSSDRDIDATQQQGDISEERYSVSHGLSSQAEAYYALGAVYRHILAESTPTMSNREMTRRRSDSLDDIDRLDYEITQMDIVRMNRIASRHLDVESIVRLPVLTYQQKNAPSKKEVTTSTPIIPEDREPTLSSSRPESRDVDNVTSRIDEEEEKNETEFSWMLVPPTHDDDSFGSSSLEQYPGYSGNNSIRSPERGRHQEHELKDTGSDVCVICLESFIPGDRLRVLPCTHSFHVGCIDRWLSGSHSFYDCYTAGCPTCKVRPDTAAMHNPTSPPTTQHPVPQIQLHESDGSVPSWALARIGHILAQESQHF